MTARRPTSARPGTYLLVSAGIAVVAGLASGATDPMPGTAEAPTAEIAAAEAKGASAASAPCSAAGGSLRPLDSLPRPGVMPAGSRMAELADEGRLRVGVVQGRYLLSYLDAGSGSLEGVEIDLIDLIAVTLFGPTGSDRVEYVVLEPGDRVPALTDGRVDLVVGGSALTCEGPQSVELSAPYLATSTRLLVPARSEVTEVEDLAGEEVCTVEASGAAGVLRQLSIDLGVMIRATLPDCVVEMQLGQAAATAGEEVVLAGLAAQDPQLVVAGRALGASEHAVGVGSDHPDLVRFVNGVLEQARADGTLATAQQRWLGPVLEPLQAVPMPRYRD